jgi:hypothetical protein
MKALTLLLLETDYTKRQSVSRSVLNLKLTCHVMMRFNNLKIKIKFIHENFILKITIII